MTQTFDCAAAAVIGNPISHSLSPIIHGYFLEKYKIRGRYDAKQIAHKLELTGFLEKFTKTTSSTGGAGDDGVSNRVGNFIGCNVTVPYKEDVLQYFKNTSAKTEISQTCLEIGAANIFYVKNETVMVDNFDYVAVLSALKKAPSKKYIMVVFGAGGMARSFFLAAKKLDTCVGLLVLNRDILKAEAALSSIGINGISQKPCYIVSLQSYLNNLAEKSHFACSEDIVVVNATTIGMKKLQDCPAAEDVNGSMTSSTVESADGPNFTNEAALLNIRSIQSFLLKLGFTGKVISVIDSVYRKNDKTNFVKSALVEGIYCTDGLDLLINQALPSFECFFGIKPEVDEKFDLRQHLYRRCTA